MLKDALTKIQAEVTAAPTKQYLAVIGGFMMDRIRNHPEDAEKVLVEGKTLAGGLNAMKELAKKNQSDGCGILTEEQGFTVVLEYFGIHVPQKADQAAQVVQDAGFSVDLDALLEG
jgi:hypothetical protein